MSVHSLALWLQNHGVGLFLRKSDPLVGVVLQNFHILGLVALLAAVLLIDLRLLGLGLTSRSAPDLARRLRPVFWLGAVTVGTSGLLMLVSDAVRYSNNDALLVKLALLPWALAFQLGVERIGIQLRPRSLPAAGTALLSLLLWVSVGLAGRAIGFV
ncbi:MAG TPA: DUF6644 family protein [Magnetospirillaceae bacterium]|nr:DUF6644 family protein [Magnetospirillaceae bacterium]